MNLKKLVGLGLLSSTLLFGELININNQEVRNEILLAGFKNNLTSNSEYFDTNSIHHVSKKHLTQYSDYKLKLKENYEDNVLNWYMHGYDRNNTLKKINDEFEWEDFRNKSKIEMTKKVDDLNNKYIGSTFVLNTLAEFSDYDFKNELFPLSLVKENTFFTVGKNYKLDNDNPNVISGETFIYFSNVNGSKHILPMIKENAKSFVKNRKDSSGNVDRKLFVRYYLIMKDIRLDRGGENRINVPVDIFTECYREDKYKYIDFYYTRHSSIISDISKIEVYDKDRKTLLHTINY